MEPLSRAFAWSWSDLVCPVTVAPGVSVRVLWHDEFGDGALLVELAPGARLPCAGEWTPWPAAMYLLRGSIADQCRTYSAGVFVHVPAGHAGTFISPDGAEAFAFVRSAAAESSPSLGLQGLIALTARRVADRP